MTNALDPHGGHDGTLDYHRRMLADVHRVSAYERALRALVRPGDVVLDLGAGTGLLSMLAARRGARVHAVESMPIAAAARRLAADNGLSDRVTVHQADVRELTPVEPVDLVVSEFMGRFVTDDFMLDAMAAATRWLKPGGRVCPAQVDLRLAPVTIGHLSELDAFATPIAGLDFRALGATAEHYAYPVSLGREALLAEPATYHTLTPPDAGGDFDAALAFEVRTPGRLRGLAGWFEAALAPGVALSNEPGTETHWGQLLFPLPALAAAEGDRIEVRLRMDEDYVWFWDGLVTPRRGEPVVFSYSSVGRLGPTPPLATPPLSTETIEGLNAAGRVAIERSDYDAAIGAFEEAVRGLGPEHDVLAPPLYENLGVAYVLAERWVPAIGAFLRALDGDRGARPQSARLLVDACRRGGHPQDAARYLRAYEKRFGLHPSSREAEQRRR